LGPKKHNEKRSSYSEFFRSHRGSKILLHGKRGAGKRHILKKWLEEEGKEAVWIKLGAMPLNPENFSLSFSSSVLSSLSLCPAFYDYESASKSLKPLPPEFAKELGGILNELEKIKPDQKLLLENAFSIAKKACKHRSFTLVIEDADLLVEMNNFPQIRDVFSVIRLEEFPSTAICVTSYERILARHLPGFLLLGVEPFTRERAEKFCESHGVTKKSDIEGLYNLTGGHQRTLKLILRAVRGRENILEAAEQEMKKESSPASASLRAELTDALARARGATMLKSILIALAKSDEMRLSEVARAVFHSAPVTKSLLERLIEVSLVEKKGLSYGISNKALASWIRLQQEVGQ